MVTNDMRCSCGNPGTKEIPRRDMPYCDACFHRLITQSIRKEAGEGPVHLLNSAEYFFEAVCAACAAAGREVIVTEQGMEPGCAEIAAAAKIKMLLGERAETNVFPKTITLKELQMFFKGDTPAKLDTLTEELIDIEHRYPGTINAIIKHTS